MASCCAFDYYSYKPCEAAQWRDRDTCFKHRGFYSKRCWTERYLRPHRIHNILGADYQPTTEMGRQRIAIEHSITSGKIVLTREDFEAIPDHRDMTAIYTILCQFPQFDPMWRPDLFQRIARIFLMLRREYMRDVTPSLAEYFKNFLKNPNFKLDQLLGQILFARETTGQWSRLIGNEYMRIYIEIANLAHPLEFYYDTECLKKRILIHPTKETRAHFVVSIIPILKQQVKDAKYKRKMSFAPIKERIVAAVYHPRHVERWLDTGGWPLFNMMFGCDDDDE